MGTSGQDRATALAREARARKAVALELCVEALRQLLAAIRAPHGSGGYFEDRCVVCVDRNRHRQGHACPCACHPAREVLDALR